MKRLALAVVLFVTSVLGAHALTYALTTQLPRPALVALGLQSAQEAVRAQFEALRPVRPYPENLAATLRGDLGKTIDGVDVAAGLREAAAQSAPRLAGGLALILAAILTTAFAPRRALGPISAGAQLLAFLPPFTAPFVVLGLGLLIGASLGDFGGWASVLAIAAPAAALAAAQAASITARNLARPFAVTIRAQGASRLRQRWRLLANLWVELAPTLEKLALGLITALLFVEPTLGLGGLGSLTARAISRSDVELLVALALAIAVMVNLLRVAALGVRRAYGVRA